MLIKSTILAQASGSVNGMVFSRNKGGAYARNRSLVTNPNTDAQQAVRNAQRTLLDAWTNTLTNDQREAWNLYAFNTPMLNRLGDVTKRSGQNMFLRANIARLQAARTMLPDAPTTWDLGAFSAPVITADASASTLSVAFNITDPWVGELGSFLFIWQSRPQNATRNFFKGPYQLAGFIAGDDTTPPTSPQVLTALFPMTAGQKMFYKANCSRADGRYSDPARPDSIVVA